MSSKIENLTATTTLASTDVIYVVKDPTTVPLDRKITFSDLEASLTSVTVPPWMPPERPVGAIDSSNTTYRLSYVPVTYSGILYLNGQVYNEGTDWTISDAIITMLTALDISFTQDGNGNTVTPNFFFKGQYAAAVPIVPPTDDALLIQDGTNLLLQDGTDLLLN